MHGGYLDLLRRRGHAAERARHRWQSSTWFAVRDRVADACFT
jgi:hypothetical protein